ncbi:hypothetical protein KUV85_13265 [Nocardioides panacisoli]|uniref:hypothetical protein n=1 Tax=Nocardioides panacisoli TaxID=627624 RepID=UPI001C63B4C8|nr:hypothetical protein [Nocardioides panacisoli]QYJ03293.1 hypothetical protein KUV85_13265 [Nocardioides panacisoli]
MPPDSPTPEEEARLRRLLADARATEPMPDDVAQRLDATLAELGRERDAAAGGDVVPLARRKRRAMVGLLAAAAVVVVAGVGVTEVLRDNGAGDAQTASEAAEEPSATAADRSRLQDGSALEQQAPEGADDSAAAPEESASQRRDLPVEVRESQGRPPRVRMQRLERDALRVRRDLPGRGSQRPDTAILFAPQGFTCEPEAWGAGVFAAVRYGARNAVLAYREPSEQNQVVEVLQCGTGAVLRSVTLAAP